MDSESNKSDNYETGRWSEQEQQEFVVGVMNFGKDWKKVQEVVKTRTGSQVRSHAQKFFLKIMKILKMRKKLIKKGKKYVPSEIDQEFIRRINRDWITEQTPSEIVSLLESSQEILKDDSKKKESVEKKKEQKQNSHHEAKEDYSSSSFRPIDSQQRVLDFSQGQQPRDFSDFKNFMGGNAPIIEESYQEESYFMHVMQRYFRHRRQSTDPLSTGYDFSSFIDFNKLTNNPEGSVQERRKKSFHLPGDEDNQQKLKRTLENIRSMRHE